MARWSARAVRFGGRYVLLDPFASGGMATVHYGRQLGDLGFGRIVAVKRLHPHLASDPAIATMFFDEARVSARIRHPNVASTLDVVHEGDELFIVLELIVGQPLSRLVGAGAAGEAVPIGIASAIVGDVLLGLHAAHEATREDGAPLGIVHRDVSPHNVLVGVDGASRIIDFGVAKAAGRLQETRDRSIKGKVAYMAPEQLSGRPVTPRTDVYSASVVLWECLTARRLLNEEGDAAVEQILLGDLDSPRRWVPALRSALEEVTMRGLARRPEDRFPTAQAMALALEAASPRASAVEVSAWLRSRAGDALDAQAAKIRAMESRGAHARRSWRPMAASVGVVLVAAGALRAIEGPERARPVAIRPETGSGSARPDAALAPSERPREALRGVGQNEPVDGGGASLPANVTTNVADAAPRRPQVALPRLRSAGAAQTLGDATADHSEPDAGPSEAECAVPYVLDSQGNKKYNRACLR